MPALYPHDAAMVPLDGRLMAVLRLPPRADDVSLIGAKGTNDDHAVDP
jgi:hypothetical protein